MAKNLEDTRNNLFDKNGNRPEDAFTKLEIYKKAIIDFARKAKLKNINIILVGSTSRNLELDTSIKEWFRPLPSKAFIKEISNAKEMNLKLGEISRNSSNIFFVDPINILDCCSNIEEYKKYYRDSDHLSEYGVRELSKRIKQILVRINSV